ncbi:uncharacterized protein LOC123660605 [Melitaea cinxia]|uniref:uncharacterized protein LOC123660605 n=1 Tax=Melitaea cinxia TaxID=113334 RepID=UPI001E2739F9|nr:uncharacterized protein LOC123660605 [Melitaea cinxia]
MPSVFDSELFDSRYSVYRCDRDYESRNEKLGGGVLIAVRKGLTVKDVVVQPSTKTCSSDVISICIGVKSNNKPTDFRVYCCYFPQCLLQRDDQFKFYEQVSESIILHPKDLYLLVGDFNISTANWSVDDTGATKLSHLQQGSHVQVNSLSTFLHINNLNQFNIVPNSNNRYLDLVISNANSVLVKQCEFPLVKEDSHHPALDIDFTYLRSNYLTGVPRVVKLFNKADYSIINKELSEVNWLECLNCLDMESAVEVFYNIINKVIDTFVPTKVVLEHRKYPIWYSSSLVKVIKEKLKFHKKWKIYGNYRDYCTFRMLRKRQKTVENDCYKKYIDHAENTIAKNSKYFWTFVKSKRQNTELPDMFYLDNFFTSDGQEITNLFNSYFYSSFESNSGISSSNSNDYDIHTCNNSLNLFSVDISLSMVDKYLKSLSLNKGSGPDGIPAIFLKSCSDSLRFPIYCLFSKSLRTSVMPSQWKRSYVIPILKSGDKHNIKNYRPISKLSCIPKMFEKIIYDIILPIIRPTIITQQHGFINRKSTETNLLEYVDFISCAMDKGFQVDAVYTDFSKAFDKISHSILLDKLKYIGVHGDLLRWIESYLANRSQAVTIKGFTSSFIPVPSGTDLTPKDKIVLKNRRLRPYPFVEVGPGSFKAEHKKLSPDYLVNQFKKLLAIKKKMEEDKD